MLMVMGIVAAYRSAGGGKVRGSQEHKVVEVKQLALYWNPHSHPLGAHLNATDNPIVNVLRREEDTPDKVVYLLRPTDVTLKLLVHILLCSRSWMCADFMYVDHRKFTCLEVFVLIWCVFKVETGKMLMFG